MRSWSHREFEIIEAENFARVGGSSGLYPAVLSVWGIVAFVVIVDWLDTAPVQIVGYVLYPLEYVINAALFPHAVTQLHGNATALLILIPTLAMMFVGVDRHSSPRRGRPQSAPIPSPDSLMRSSIFALAAALAVAAIPSAQPFAQLATMTPAPSQNPQFTSDPEAWRPVAHYDLALPTGEAEAYASIWQDRLDESNRKPPPAPLPGQKPNPAMSYAVGNRGASEWNFSINFQSKLVVLTVLHTPHVCTDEYPSPSLAAKIKVCPMRLVTFEGDHYSIIDGAACFLLKTGEGPIEDFDGDHDARFLRCKCARVQNSLHGLTYRHRAVCSNRSLASCRCRSREIGHPSELKDRGFPPCQLFAFFP